MIEGLYDKQRLFDHVVRHLFKQHAKAVSTIDGKVSCRYRAANGLKCAIGCVIADDQYYPAMENMNVRELFESLEISIGRKIQKPNGEWSVGTEYDMLVRLQNAHDHRFVYEWPMYLKIIADEHKLEFNFTEEDWKGCVA